MYAINEEKSKTGLIVPKKIELDCLQLIIRFFGEYQFNSIHDLLKFRDISKNLHFENLQMAERAVWKNSGTFHRHHCCRYGSGKHCGVYVL